MFNKKLSTALITASLLFGSYQVLNAQATTKHEVNQKLNIINFEKAQKLYNEKSAIFLDARGMKLYKKGTIMGAMSFPTGDYSKLKKFLPADKNVAIVTFCNGFACEKSDVLAEKLQNDAFTNILVYKGGYPEWEAKKSPLMAIKKECKEKKVTTGSYKPTIEASEINGVNVYLLEEDGEANEDGVIDQFWLADKLKNNALPKGITIVDVRKTEKYNAEHIDGAISVPFDSKSETLDTSKLPEDGVIVFYCNTGLKSTDARNSIEDDDLLERVLVFDATYKCDDKTNKNCEIQPNEAI